jgi:hypothetical protein
MRRYLEGVSLTAFTRGSRVLVVRIKARTNYRPTWQHAGWAAGAGFLFWPVVGKWAPTAVTVTVVLWVVTAVVVGSAANQPQTADADQIREPEDEPQEAPADATLYALIRHTADLSDQGTAAHLDDVLAEGQKRGLLGGWEKADLKEHLAALGAPLVEGKKLTFGGRQRNRQAVLLKGLPEADPAPVPALTSRAPGEAA